MSEWKRVEDEEPPKDGTAILVFGQPDDLKMGGDTMVIYGCPGIYTRHYRANSPGVC
jgi:hypothetical protein